MSAHYALLEREALLHLTGPDSLTFLQGQTTCDTRKVDSGTTVAGAYCTPQGRMVCDFQLGQVGEEHFLLRLRADIAEAAVSTFGKYIVFSKAELDPQRRDWQVVACWGDTVGEALREIIGGLPAGPNQAMAGEGYLLVQVDEAGTQFEAWLDMAQHGDHFETIQQHLEPGDSAAWEALQIRAGLGRVEGGTVEEFLPQMLNYDVVGHVAFDKGCYTGQEIVARLHYRGKAKRRMYLAESSQLPPLPAGTALSAIGSESNAGTVVNSVASEGAALYLVSATESAAAAGLSAIGDASHQLYVGSLPYSIPD